jgi:hypothetical protein
MEQSQLKQGNDPNPRGKAIPTQAAEPRNSLAQPVRAGFVQEGKDSPGGAQANSVKESQRGGPSRSLLLQVRAGFLGANLGNSEIIKKRAAQKRCALCN